MNTSALAQNHALPEADLGDPDRIAAWPPVSPASPKYVAESLRVGRAIGAVMMQCWFNARKAILSLPEYADAGYIEGWAVLDKMLVIEHGWIAKNGFVIDPTLPEQQVVYFPGLEFPGRAGIEAFLATKEGKKCKKSPFFYAFGWGGKHSPGYQKAFRDAMAYSSSFATQQGAA